MLAAIAGRTERIRLGTAVTVLSTQDPVRVYTEFATLDAVSNGRAQLIVGRGSLTDSFPLFGFDLADYETLFEEKLDLLTRLLRDQPVTWSGSSRSPLTDQYVSPPSRHRAPPDLGGCRWQPPVGDPAARYGLPLMLAIIGGHPEPIRPLVELYKRALTEYGHPPLPVGMHSLGFVAPTDEEAVEVQWPHWTKTFEAASAGARLGPPDKKHFEAEIAEGSLYVGSPETVATKIAGEHPAARAQPIRPGLRRRSGPPRTADGDHRPLRARGDPPGPRAAGR